MTSRPESAIVQAILASPAVRRLRDRVQAVRRQSRPSGSAEGLARAAQDVLDMLTLVASGELNSALTVTRVDVLEGALRELVALKDGPRDEDYYRRKEAAWEAARAALASLPEPDSEEEA